MEPLARLTLRNVDPVKLPVSAQLLEGIRGVLLQLEDKTRDTDTVLTEVAMAVIELESHHAEVKAILRELIRIVDDLCTTTGVSNNVVVKLTSVVDRIVDHIEPPR